MARDALIRAGIDHDILTAQDVVQGILVDYPLLFVPGGWASLKTRELGKEGRNAIRSYVRSGGNYFGICGGAGLALEVDGGLGLLPVKRLSTSRRVPSFSGEIHIQTSPPNKTPFLWDDIGTGIAFHAWWPSQFSIRGKDDISILAYYGVPTRKAYSSDIPLSALPAGDPRWATLEENYGILLDPARLQGEPAVISGTYGSGHIILSMLHFDTPDDLNGQVVLRNLALTFGVNVRRIHGAAPTGPEPACRDIATETSLLRMTRELMDLGEENFLWRWRNRYLTQWRRGVRGLEFCTLYVIARTLSDHFSTHPESAVRLEAELRSAESMLSLFSEKASRLIFLERIALQKGRLTFSECEEPEIKELRIELFSQAKSHGGLFKKLLDQLDYILLQVLQRCGTETSPSPSAKTGPRET